MPLQFDEVYLLTDVEGAFMKTPQIALGVRRRPVDQAKGDIYQFLVNQEERGHEIVGEVIRDVDGVVELHDHARVADDGRSAVVWRFEPLTLSIWEQLGADGFISKYEELRKQIDNDAQLKAFYRDAFLAEWWKEFE
jgi:hypothetical protein